MNVLHKDNVKYYALPSIEIKFDLTKIILRLKQFSTSVYILYAVVKEKPDLT